MLPFGKTSWYFIRIFKMSKMFYLKYLNNHAQLRCVRANQAPYMSKNVSKEIIKRSHLGAKFLRAKSNIIMKAYNKRRNYAVGLQEKRN